MAELLKNIDKPGVIAFYLPQFHPILENDEWWGKGFTEWTNVGKAKPLFPGHYQPHVPADLGYYDLRVSETREQQALMAKEYGVDGFCYWHYWFGNGKRLLERPFNEVLESGKPDFPFCLGWANHSWEAKNWSTGIQKKKILIEQQYPGITDCQDHFNFVKKCFQDKRYILFNGKPVFVIWQPEALPPDYLKIWRELAVKNGFKGIVFIGFTYEKNIIDQIYKMGYDHVIYDGLFDSVRKNTNYSIIYNKILKKIFNIPLRLNYMLYQKTNMEVLLSKKTLPCILPNYDHTPRSGKNGTVLMSSPELFKDFLNNIIKNIKNKKITEPIIFLKSWNEWGEGNHMEPDLRFKKSFLENLRDGLSDK